MIKVELVFFDWRARRLGRVSGSERMMLETGVFHPGTAFKGTIDLDKDQKAELASAWVQGFRPVFWMFSGKEEK